MKKASKKSKMHENSTTSFVQNKSDTYTSKENILFLDPKKIGDWTDTTFISHPESYDVDEVEDILISEGWGAELKRANKKIGTTLLKEELSLEALRLSKGLSQKQLAEKTGFEQYQISHYENGRNKPGFEAIKKLSKVLEVDVNTLFEALDK